MSNISNFQTPIPLATQTNNGLVSTVAQAFAGIKIFYGGLSAVGTWATASGGTISLTNAANRQLFYNTTSNTQLNLPSTGIVAGEVFYVYSVNSGGNLTIATGSGTPITLGNAGTGSVDSALINNGHCFLIAKVNGPSFTTDWLVADLNDELTVTGTTGGAITEPFSLTMKKTNSQIIASTSCASGSASASSAITYPNGTISASFLNSSAVDINGPTVVISNGNTMAGWFGINGSNGSAFFAKFDTSNFSGSSGIGGSSTVASMNWSIQ